MKKLLWVGDGPDCPSGFGKATREILNVLQHSFAVTVLGINHRGDPGTVEYPVYSAYVGGDAFGVGRLIWMCDTVKPDVIVIQNDGWNVPFYIKQLSLFEAYKNVPVVAIVAVDGKNFQGAWLNGVNLAIFWTQFALDEAREGGYAGPAAVIPLGVDRNVFHPIAREEARRHLPAPLRDAFIIGNVNRNQPRKRWDLTVKYFATWIQQHEIRDAWLYLHTAPTGDVGCDVVQLAKYYSVVDRIAVVTPETFYGVSEQAMARTYNCFDVLISTTQGEGMGLPALEAMACGVPCVLPDWAAYSDWAKNAAALVPCSSTMVGQPFQNVIGGVVDETEFIKALNVCYFLPQTKTALGAASLARASERRFQWDTIGRSYGNVLNNVLGQPVADEPTAGVPYPRLAERDRATASVDGLHTPTEAEWTDLGRPQEATP